MRQTSFEFLDSHSGCCRKVPTRPINKTKHSKIKQPQTEAEQLWAVSCSAPYSRHSDQIKPRRQPERPGLWIEKASKTTRMAKSYREQQL